MAFATPEDVATRLGRELNAIEAGTCELLLDAVDALIAQAASQPDSWPATVSPVPAVLRYVEVEVVARVFLNPAGAQQFSEQLGAYSVSESFSRDRAGLELTATEQRLVRRAVHGTAGSGSVAVGSVIDDLYTTGS